MRITSIDILTSDDSEPITLSIFDRDPTAQFITKNIVGLDAEDIVPKFYASGLQHGARFYQFVLKPRDIVAKVQLNPRIRLDESFSDVRDTLYKAISSSRTGQIKLFFKAGGLIIAQAIGLITKFEASHFVAIPEVQITISCEDPIFRGVKPTIFGPSELSPSNPVVIPDSISNAPHGFSMQMVFNTPEPSFNVQDIAAGPDWFFQVTPDGGFLVGDILHIASDYGNIQCYLVRGIDVSYIVDKVSPQSVWPILFPGSNSFHFSEITSWDWVSVEYFPAYWGV